MDDPSSFPSRFQKSPADAHTRHTLTDHSTLVTYFPTGAKVVFSVESGDPWRKVCLGYDYRGLE